MAMSENPLPEEDRAWIGQVRQQWQRQLRSRREGEPSLLGQLASVGVLGWVLVVPTLLGIALGRWLDAQWHTGITFTAALLVLGVVLGGWSAWRWIHRR
jgi:ATP synthase protein I